MAQVKINIPGIGEVVAEGAASEETLNKLLVAMSKSEKTKQRDEKREADNRRKALADEAKASKEAAEQLNRLTDAERKALQDQAAKKRAAEEFTQSLVAGATDIGLAVGSTATSLAKSAISVATQMATQYNTITNNPISAAAGMLNTGIDMLGKGAKGVASGVASVGDILMSAKNPLAIGLGAILFGLGKAANAATDAAVATAKVANDLMAAEFAKTVSVFGEFNKSGASFAGGMDQMRIVSHSSGLSMETFSKAAVNASDALRSAGFSQGEGAMALAGVMRAASRITNTSGATLQQQMLALGVGFEDQGRLMAEVMAQDRVSGRERRLSDEEVAKRTKDYAIDLKVLADITGKNAQEAMKQAQIKSMEADIIAQLGSPDEVAKFQAAFAATPDSLKKGFLEYFSSGGTAVTDTATAIMMAQSPAIGENFQKMMNGIRDAVVPTAGFSNEVLSSYAAIGEEMRKNLDPTLSQVVRFGTASGAVAGAVEIQNELIRRGMIKPEDVAKSEDAAKKQAEALTGTTRAFVDITTQAEKFKTTMEELASAALPTYAKLLDKTFTETTDLFIKGLNWIKSQLNNTTTTPAPIAPVFTGPSATAATVGTGNTRAAAGRRADAQAEVLRMVDAGQSEADIAKAIGQNLEMTRALIMEAQQRADASFVDQGMSFARGGVAAGPLTGFKAMLHGVEAVVPLDGGRSIPVSIAANPNAMSSPEEIEMQNNITIMAEAQTRLVELMQNFVEKQEESNRHLEDASYNMARLLQATS
jgi:hypothetical protein